MHLRCGWIFNDHLVADFLMGVSKRIVNIRLVTLSDNDQFSKSVADTVFL